MPLIQRREHLPSQPAPLRLPAAPRPATHTNSARASSQRLQTHAHKRTPPHPTPQQQQAYLLRALQHLDEFLAAAPPSEAPPAEALAAALAANGLDLADLRRRAALVRRGLVECENDAGWRVVSDDSAAGGMRLLYRHGPKETTHSFKATVELECALPELLSMARECERF